VQKHELIHKEIQFIGENMRDLVRTSIKIPTDTLIKIKDMAVKKGISQNKFYK